MTTETKVKKTRRGYRYSKTRYYTVPLEMKYIDRVLEEHGKVTEENGELIYRYNLPNVWEDQKVALEVNANEELQERLKKQLDVYVPDRLNFNHVKFVRESNFGFLPKKYKKAEVTVPFTDLEAKVQTLLQQTFGYMEAVHKTVTLIQERHNSLCLMIASKSHLSDADKLISNAASQLRTVLSETREIFKIPVTAPVNLDKLPIED